MHLIKFDFPFLFFVKKQHKKDCFYILCSKYIHNVYSKDYNPEVPVIK